MKATQPSRRRYGMGTFFPLMLKSVPVTTVRIVKLEKIFEILFYNLINNVLT